MAGKTAKSKTFYARLNAKVWAPTLTSTWTGAKHEFASEDDAIRFLHLELLALSVIYDDSLTIDQRRAKRAEIDAESAKLRKCCATGVHEAS